MKKVLAVLLALVLSVSMFTGIVSADDEPVQLKVVFMHVIGSLEDAEVVEAAINEYIQPIINATVDIEWIDLGDYFSQMTPRLASGEAMDVVPTFANVVSSYYGMDAMTPLDDLIAEYGQGIVESVGADYMKAGEINGVQYTIPIVAAFAQQPALLYREDIVEELGLDLSTVTKLEDLTPIFEQVKAAHPEMYMICANSIADSEGLLREWTWDGLSDEFGVLMDPLNSTEVTNLYETETYANYVKLMREWYLAGYIQTDAATCTDSMTTLFDTGMYFGTIAKDYPNNIEEKFAMAAYPWASIPLEDPLSTTTYITNNVMFIPVTAEHPEKAMEFLNLLYTDATLQNYINYGIEGQHYRMVGDNLVDYLEGQFIMTAKYVSAFHHGNFLLSYNRVGDLENCHEILIEWNNSAPKSLALGFSYDSADVANELVALSNVVAKYRRGLDCGSLDPEVELPKFISELKSAGIDDVIALKQEQLDAWLAAQ